jgi:hypothetical protein
MRRLGFSRHRLQLRLFILGHGYPGHHAFELLGVVGAGAIEIGNAKSALSGAAAA